MRHLCLLLLALSGCFAHERALVAQGAKCPSIELSASAAAETLAVPHVITATEAAAGTAMVGLGSLAQLFGTAAPVTLIVPAGTVQIGTAGWRQYEGCNVSAICFDAGYCAPIEGPRLQPLIHSVPRLMEKSLAEMSNQFPGCQNTPVLGRRGPLVWTLHACGSTLGCFVTTPTGYDCIGADGDKRPHPGSPSNPVMSQ